MEMLRALQAGDYEKAVEILQEMIERKRLIFSWYRDRQTSGRAEDPTDSGSGRGTASPA